MLLLAPVYCAGCVAGDRERRVLELVLITRLSNVEIVAGKFLVRLLELCMFAVATLPALFLCLLLGGVPWQGVIVSNSLLLTMIAFVGSVSLIVSILTPRVMSAVIINYVVLIGIWFGVPILWVLRYYGSVGPSSAWAWGAVSLHPFMGAMDAVEPANLAATPIAGAALWCIEVYAVITLLMLGVATLTIRRWGLWASRESVPRAKKDRKSAARRVWDNPVAWREVKTIAVHRRMRMARILALLLLIVLSAPVWVFYLADLIAASSPMPSDSSAVEIVIPGTAVIAWLLMALQGSMSFAFERDRNTLDALLTTPLTGLQIIWGKFAGILRSSAFALAFPLGFSLLAALHGVVSWRAAILSMAIVAVGSLLAAAWGLYCSVSTDSSTRAAVVALGAAMILCVAAPIAMATLFNFGEQLNSFPVTAISPTINLSYSICERPNRTSTLDRFVRFNRNRDWLLAWDGRIPYSAAHLALALGITLLCFLQSARKIDSQHRTGPRTEHARRRVIANLDAKSTAP